jgi:hypothetical protein
MDRAKPGSLRKRAPRIVRRLIAFLPPSLEVCGGFNTGVEERRVIVPAAFLYSYIRFLMNG